MRALLTIALRWCLSAALLTTVWFNAHWSVALTLTLLAFGLEILGIGIAIHISKTTKE